jgi:hypothetical protein
MWQSTSSEPVPSGTSEVMMVQHAKIRAAISSLQAKL